MKKLDKLIIKAFIGPFIATFFVTLFVLIMQFLWKWIDDLVGKGLDSITIGKLLFYMSTTMVPLALPLAVLLSSIMTFGNLGESFELVALKSSGISLLRFMRPLIITSFFISGLAFLFANYAIPIANLQAKSLLYDIVNLKHGFNIQEGVFFDEIEGYSIRVAKKDPDGKTIHGVIIYDRSTGNSDKLIVAKTGVMQQSPDHKYVYFLLKDGWQYEEQGNRASLDNEFIRVGFKRFRKVLDLSSFALSRTPVDLFEHNYQMLNIRQLSHAIDSIHLQDSSFTRDVQAYVSSHYAFYRWRDTGWLQKPVPALKVDSFASVIPDSTKRYLYDRLQMQVSESKGSLSNVAQNYDDMQSDIINHQIELERKFSLSFACMVLFLIGAPLGSIVRKGGLGTPLVFAVIFFIIFHVFNMIGEKLADKGVLSPAEGMWLSTAILLPIAGFLIYKALNDSNLFNKEFYFRFFRRIRKWLNINKR